MNAGAYGKIRAMPRPHPTPVPTPAEAAQWAPERVVELAQAHAALQREVQTIQHQLEWFRRQLFGQKSEKRPLAPHPAQLHLGELPIPDAPPEPPGKPVAGHTRRTPRTDFAQDKNDAALFFDEARVPVETIAAHAGTIAYELLCAVGRSPRVTGYGLEALGIPLTARGSIGWSSDCDKSKALACCY